MSILIIANVMAVMLETEDKVYKGNERLFWAFEIFSVGIFTAEYLVRLWTCTAERKFGEGWRGRLRFIFQPLSLIDLLSIVPTYLPLALPDLRMLRMVRLARLLRLFKLGRYSHAMHTLGRVLRDRRSELGVAISAVFMVALVAASLMYFVEHDAQPNVFSSIPASLWWAVVTLTTVGYGDVYPITPGGKLLAGVISLLSVGMFALPAGILASGFNDEVKRRHGRSLVCPHCGERIQE